MAVAQCLKKFCMCEWSSRMAGHWMAMLLQAMDAIHNTRIMTCIKIATRQGVGLTEVLRALARTIEEVRRENPPPYLADPQSVRETEALGEDDAPPTSKGWSP